MQPTFFDEISSGWNECAHERGELTAGYNDNYCFYLGDFTPEQQQLIIDFFNGFIDLYKYTHEIIKISDPNNPRIEVDNKTFISCYPPPKADFLGICQAHLGEDSIYTLQFLNNTLTNQTYTIGNKSISMINSRELIFSDRFYESAPIEVLTRWETTGYYGQLALSLMFTWAVFQKALRSTKEYLKYRTIQKQLRKFTKEEVKTYVAHFHGTVMDYQTVFYKTPREKASISYLEEKGEIKVLSIEKLEETERFFREMKPNEKFNRYFRIPDPNGLTHSVTRAEKNASNPPTSPDLITLHFAAAMALAAWAIYNLLFVTSLYSTSTGTAYFLPPKE